MDIVQNIFVYFVGAFFQACSIVYCWGNLINNEVEVCKKKFFSISIFMSIVETILNLFLPKTLKFICTFIFLIVVAYKLLDKKIVKAMTIVAISQLVIFGAECIYVIVGHYAFGYELSELNKMSVSLYGGFILNIYIAIFSSVFVKTNIPRKVYETLYSLHKPNNRRVALFYVTLMILSAMISTIESWMNISISIVFITNTVLTLIFVYMVIKFANSENNYNQMNIKYRTSLTSLQEYGEMINKYKISNHENKNQLRTIQNMTTDENVIKFVESVLKEKKHNDIKIINKIIKIPEGEIRALLHAKISKIDELGIKYKLDISKDVKTTSLIDLSDAIRRDTCTVLGVFLDNSIECVKDLEKKEINIELYIIDEFLYIDIINNFEGTLNAENLSNIGYTTKGNGHGYGLALVDNIVKYNKNIIHECEINKNYITQRVIIKM